MSEQQPPARVSFIVFAPLTGQILRTGTCAQTDLHLQAGLGEAVIEGQAEPYLIYRGNLQQHAAGEGGNAA